MRAFWLGLIALLGGCYAAPNENTQTPTPSPLLSGSTFLTADTRALQDDDFANPAMLWVDKGAAIFARDCAQCHTDDPRIDSAATRYPAIDTQSGTLLNLEGRINQCHVRHMQTSPLDYEGDDLLSLTAYVGHRAKGQPSAVSITPEIAADYAAGERYYFTRRGQFNLSCAQCHNAHWGQNLRGDNLSQGHGNGFPAYRFEWEGVGSLHRRFADCDRGVRAEPHTLGSSVYTQLELYLAIRAGDLPIETPAIRR